MTKPTLERGIEIQNSIRGLNDALNHLSKVKLFGDGGCAYPRYNIDNDLSAIENDIRSTATLKIMAIIEGLEKEFDSL